MKYHFLDRLINLGLPRTGDFQGVNPNSFVGHGNYSIGIRDQSVFPEIRLVAAGYQQRTIFENIHIQEGVVVARRGPEAEGLRPQPRPRPRLLERGCCPSRVAAEWEELQAEVDQLLEAWTQMRRFHSRGREDHRLLGLMGMPFRREGGAAALIVRKKKRKAAPTMIQNPREGSEPSQVAAAYQSG